MPQPLFPRPLLRLRSHPLSSLPFPTHSKRESRDHRAVQQTSWSQWGPSQPGSQWHIWSVLTHVPWMHEMELSQTGPVHRSAQMHCTRDTRTGDEAHVRSSLGRVLSAKLPIISARIKSNHGGIAHVARSWAGWAVNTLSRIDLRATPWWKPLPR